MKFWLTSAKGFNNHWGFKIQTTISSNHNESFLLQDVYATYQLHKVKLRIGQFVPEFSLQRFQPDYVVPLAERSAVVNALIPNGSLGARDIGLEGGYTGPGKKLQTWLGVYNGYGIKRYQLNYQGILLTQKTAFLYADNHLYSGYSVMYRKADQLQLKSVLPDSVLFTGNDIRFNIFTRFITGKWQFQAEYFRASLEQKMADGYYILASLTLSKNQIVTSWNKYNDLIANTDNNPVIHFGYNRLVNGNKLKLMVDDGIRFTRQSIDNQFLTLQMQLFFN